MRRNAKITLGAAAVGLVAMASGPLVAAHASSEPSHVPDAVKVPPGNEFQFSTDATGTQNYQCQADGTWKFVGPSATLSEDGEPIIDHSSFPGPKGPVPTWEDRVDKSKVKGKKIAESPRNRAIPALLLSTTPVDGAPPGDLTDITYIQRLNTTGGLAPSFERGENCSDYLEDNNVQGDTVGVGYTANYVFYAAS